MPLNVYKRGKVYWLRGTVRGTPVHETTGTADPKRAEAARIRREGEIFDRALHGAKAVADFQEAAIAYLEEKPRSDRDKDRIEKLAKHFGKRKLSDIGQQSLAGAYKACLSQGEAASPGAKLRGVVAPLRAILRNAALHKLCDMPVLKPPTVAAAPTTYLKPEEVRALIEAAVAHLRPLLIFLAGTGARMSEATELDWADIDLRGKRARLKQKQKVACPIRDADLPPVVVQALEALPHRTGAVFRPHKPGERAPKPGEWQGYRIDRENGGHIKRAWATACRRAGLPGRWREWTTKKGRAMREWVPDVTPHDLRHTWASWHYAIHRDLLGLKQEGGWSTIAMVERYAKRMPDAYRAEAEAWLAGTAPVAAPRKRARPKSAHLKLAA